MFARPNASVEGDLQPSITVDGTQATLSDLSVSPTTGDYDTKFTFRVKYTSPSNMYPKNLYLVRRYKGDDTTKNYSMGKEDSYLPNYTRGCYFTVTLQFTTGDITFYAKAQDASGFQVTSSSRSLTVNTSPSGYAMVAIIVVIVIACCALMCGCMFKKGKTGQSQSHTHFSSNAQANNQAGVRFNNFGSLVGQRINGIMIQSRPSCSQDLMVSNAAPAHPRLSHGWTQWDDNSHSWIEGRVENAREWENHMGIAREWEHELVLINPKLPRSAFIPALPNESRPPMNAGVASAQAWDQPAARDEVCSVLQNQSEDFVIPAIDPAILEGIETWDEQALEMLAQSSDDEYGMPNDASFGNFQGDLDQSGMVTLVPANVLLVDEDTQDENELIPNTNAWQVLKIQRTYVDVYEPNDIVHEHDARDAPFQKCIDDHATTKNEDENSITLMVCDARDELGPLVPLRWLVRQHLAMLVRNVAS